MFTGLAGRLRKHTCLYASFDKTVDADISRGDGKATYNSRVVRHDMDGGRYGGALVFSIKDHGWGEDEFLYAAQGNFPYSSEPFSGTISLWLNCDPDEDLYEAYPVDPFHISRHPADGSFYIDLTRPNDERYGSPRKLRFGLYGDSPARERHVGGQLIVVGELGWKAEDWHHVVATWRNVNTGKNNGAAALYVDGRRRGWMEGYTHLLIWHMEDLTIGLGQRYVGKIDELLILDVALSHEEVEDLYRLSGPAGEMLGK
jgi:hypothetical protein